MTGESKDKVWSKEFLMPLASFEKGVATEKFIDLSLNKNVRTY